MSGRLPCRSTVNIRGGGVTCQGVEDGHENHTATIAGQFTTTDTYGPEPLTGDTRVTVTWTAPVRGLDMRVRTRENRAAIWAALDAADPLLAGELAGNANGGRGRKKGRRS